MSTEVDVMEATGELTNASAARGPTPTLVVRRPDDGSRPEIPVMTLRSHSRGGRSSACALEPSRQAGSYPTGNENLGVHPTRQEKSGPEPEVLASHRNCPSDPPSVGMGLNRQPPETIPTTSQPPQAYTGPQEPVDTGPKHKVFAGSQVFTITLNAKASSLKSDSRTATDCTNRKLFYTKHAIGRPVGIGRQQAATV